MSSRLTRKDIKRDEVLETLGGFVGFVSRHGRAIMLGVVALIVLALAAAGYRGLSERKAARANEALAEALAVYAPQTEEDAPAESESNTRAREHFTAVAEEYAGTDAADIAGAYLGSIAAAEGDLEAAREHWQRFVDRQGDHLLAQEVRLNLMALDKAMGRSEQLVDELRAELASTRPSLPEEVLLDQLGRTLESLGRGDEAADIYRRLVKDFPMSTYARNASERLAELEAAAGEA